jgi:hypothetical protein
LFPGTSRVPPAFVIEERGPCEQVGSRSGILREFDPTVEETLFPRLQVG